MRIFFVNGHICSDFGSKSPIFSNLEVCKKKTKKLDGQDSKKLQVISRRATCTTYLGIKKNYGANFFKTAFLFKFQLKSTHL